MAEDLHQKAAKFHEPAAWAHVAAAHHRKEDIQAGQQNSKQALADANKSFPSSQEAREKSVKSTGKA